MIMLVLQLVLAAAVTFALACVPGWAIVRLLQLQLRLPITAQVPAAFAFGLGMWTVVFAGALAAKARMEWALAAYALIAVVAWALEWRLQRRRGLARRGTDVAGTSGWTILLVAVATFAGLLLRTRLAFDALFHLGIVRRIAELPNPGFDNLDRIVGSGVNPAYAVPTWQGMLASVSVLTRLDPATVFEASAMVALLLAACAAAAFGRALTGTRVGELAGCAAYVWLRVAFPRRELEGDGVAYSPIPGNIALDVLVPLLLVATILLLRSRTRRRGDGALVTLLAVATALIVVLHANYIAYVAIIGAGTLLWLLAAGPFSRKIAARVGLVVTSVVVPGLVILAALLPVLMLLDHFASPAEVRIDYHLVSLWGIDVIRPGHLYDWFAAPGLLAILAVPWSAWISRGVTRALVCGGLFALMLFAFVPGMIHVLDATGSRTLTLRLPRPVGVLLIGVAAIVLPDLAARTMALAARVRERRGVWAARAVSLAPIVATLALVAAYGYPLARREPPQYGWNWPSVVAALGLLAVFLHSIVRRDRSGDPRPVLADDRAVRSLAPRSLAIALALLAVAMLPSGLMSMRRGMWQSRELVASYKADDLRCFDGVQKALRAIPAGDVLLADPVTAYGAQALAPAYVVGDFKVWNGVTDEARIERRISLLDHTFQTSRAQVAGYGLARLSKDYDARWVLVSDGEVQPPVGSELYPYDAKGLRELLRSGDAGATKIASGPGRMPSNTTDDERAECDLELWKLNGSERDLEYETDESGMLLHGDSTTGKADDQ